MTLTHDHLTFWQQHNRPSWAEGVSYPAVSIDVLINGYVKPDMGMSALMLLKTVRKNQVYANRYGTETRETLRAYLAEYDTKDHRYRTYKRWLRTMDKKRSFCQEKDLVFLKKVCQVF